MLKSLSIKRFVHYRSRLASRIYCVEGDLRVVESTRIVDLPGFQYNVLQIMKHVKKGSKQDILTPDADSLSNE